MISHFISKDKSVKGTRSWLCDFRILSYLKGLGQDLTSNLKKKIPCFNVQNGKYNVLFNPMSAFESQILSYMRVTEFIILCFVNKVRVLLLFTYGLYWYKF